MNTSKTVFSKQKEQCLDAVDLSRKGTVDATIVDLVNLINKQPQYFTTSSCSGRICIYEQGSGSVKKGCRWLYVSHEPSNAASVIEEFKRAGSEGNAAFKFEPFILHTQCESLADAQMMHAAAVASGFRNSGLTVSKAGKIMAAVRSSQVLDAPLTRNGELIVSEQYIEYLVEIANMKMQENLERINRFIDNLKAALSERNVQPSQRNCKKKRMKCNCHQLHDVSRSSEQSMDVPLCCKHRNENGTKKSENTCDQPTDGKVITKATEEEVLGDMSDMFEEADSGT